MKEIVIISGKGGTGKTSITAAFASLAEKLVLVDCDVDAADLHLILTPAILETVDFYGGKVADINQNLCLGCGICYEVCRYGSVSCPHKNDGGNAYYIDPVMCEGCGVCVHFCPEKAINFTPALNGQWFISDTRAGKMVHAKLGATAENSGKLVTVIRQKAREIAESTNMDYIINDGPPGIGCAVIASITGVDMVVIVTEPTISGIHDMERVIKLTRHFHIPTSIIINKSDLNKEKCNEIIDYASSQQINILGEIMYNPIITQAQLVNKSIIEYGENDVSLAVAKIWERLRQIL
jgi:MinD superfamily P-loop ATPase